MLRRIINQYKMLYKTVFVLLMKQYFAPRVVKFKKSCYGWKRGKERLEVVSLEGDDRKLYQHKHSVEDELRKTVQSLTPYKGQEALSELDRWGNTQLYI